MRSELIGSWRELRLAAGLTQATVARASGIARSTYADLERGRTAQVNLLLASIVSAALGQDLSVKLYPFGSPVRDAAHLRLLSEFVARLSAFWRVTHEAPLPIEGDRRAWDLLLNGPASIGVEAETRLGDVQALERAIHLKQRDSGVRRVLLVVRGSKRNRMLIRHHLPHLRTAFPLGTAEVMRALREGRDPGADGLAVL
ncbi:MAG: helix-turn-helix transcriptional regulator [Chloroflexota bacterium]|nr:helix-turn-helix transcriptional regulator [Chloroflexota bacterium]